MANVTIYHNPRCSKSRQTLALLQKQGVTPNIIEYLKNPLNAATLKAVIKKLGVRPIELIRKKEEPYAKLKLANKQDDDAALITAMVQHPILIERPVVVKGSRAAIGRPPEKILEIL